MLLYIEFIVATKIQHWQKVWNILLINKFLNCWLYLMYPGRIGVAFSLYVFTVLLSALKHYVMTLSLAQCSTLIF